MKYKKGLTYFMNYLPAQPSYRVKWLKTGNTEIWSKEKCLEEFGESDFAHALAGYSDKILILENASCRK